MNRTHTLLPYANPHLICEACWLPVDSWHDPTRCGCDSAEWTNQPCGHTAGLWSGCESWSPDNGCTCPTACQENP